MTYTYDCPPCGEWDEQRPVAAADNPATCPHCGEVFTEKSPRGRLVVRVVTMPQVLIPGHFGHTVSTTGLKDTMGPGPWEELRRKNRKWNSGANAPTRKKDRPRTPGKSFAMS